MKLHVVDGTFELFRAYYSKAPGHTTPAGMDGKPTAQLIRSLLALLHDEDEDVTHIAYAFDNPIESFRNDMFWGYKTAAGMDPVLVANMDPAEEAVRALGVTVWRMDEWEADDALATAAARWADDVDEVRLLTPDKDVGQCLHRDDVVMVDRIRKKVTNGDGVREKFGVEPASIPDYLGLVGDTADGIPGLPGWGAKSTARVLEAYGHIENIPAMANDWSVRPRGADKLAATLRENREDALLFRDLAVLQTDVPLLESLDDLRFDGVPRAAFESWCDAFGMLRLKDRPTRWRTSE